MVSSWSDSEANRWVKVGKITKSHGLNGFVKLLPYSSNPERLTCYSRFRGVSKLGEIHNLLVEKISCQPKTFLVKFQGIDSKEAADSLAGLELSVPASDLPPLEDGEYYHADLIDCLVFDQQGHELGRIKEIIETGSNDVYSVVNKNGEILLPALKRVIISVDTKRKRMVVNPLKGLLD